MKVCIEINDIDSPIKLEQDRRSLFTVTYGQHVKAGLSYYGASLELGSCIMHALACVGKLDNRKSGEL